MGILLFGVLEVAIALAASVPVTLAAALLGGVGVMFFVVNVNTVLQSDVPDRYLGRTFGAQLTMGALVALVGSPLAGVLGDRIGVRVTFSIGGLLFIAAGIVALTTLVPTFKGSDGAWIPDSDAT